MTTLAWIFLILFLISHFLGMFVCCLFFIDKRSIYFKNNNYSLIKNEKYQLMCYFFWEMVIVFRMLHSTKKVFYDQKIKSINTRDN